MESKWAEILPELAHIRAQEMGCAHSSALLPPAAHWGEHTAQGGPSCSRLLQRSGLPLSPSEVHLSLKCKLIDPTCKTKGPVSHSRWLQNHFWLILQQSYPFSIKTLHFKVRSDYTNTFLGHPECWNTDGTNNITTPDELQYPWKRSLKDVVWESSRALKHYLSGSTTWCEMQKSAIK